MLKLTANPAKGFLADAQVRSYKAEGNSFEYVGRLLQQIFVALFGCFKLCIHKPFFQPDIIFFISYSHQPLHFVVPVK